MPLLNLVLIGGCIAAALAWASLSLYIVVVDRRRRATRRVLSAVLETLGSDDSAAQGLSHQQVRLESLLEGASRELVLRAAADAATTERAFHALATYLSNTWGIAWLRGIASQHRSARDKWRRMAALRILFRLGDADRLTLLASAIDEPDHDVAAVALGLLATCHEPRALDILFDALRQQRHPASRVAAHIEQSPLAIVDRLRGMLDDDSPVIRLWSATLLARDPDPALEPDLARLVDDHDPRVRKAAIQTLAKIGDQLAMACAARLLTDDVPFVRAHAARALGELGSTDHAVDVAGLLADPDWWVRLAAKESLELMGPEVWPILMRCIEHEDGFVRNGAAEVMQNLGVLDSLIVMEAATDSPAASKIDSLRRIAAAGGTLFTDALVERAGPVVGPRIRRLLATIGLDHVGAH